MRRATVGRRLRAPLVASAFIALGALVARGSVQDALTGKTSALSSLTLPAAYVILSPLSRLLDAISLLSVSQHWALATTVLLLFVAWRVHAARRDGTVRIRREIGRTTGFTGVLVLCYGGAAALPRPMAAIRVNAPDVVVVDFHSHTYASHDARRSLTTTRNRAWHRASGYHVAYVSDHLVFHGASAARELNPARAGDGVSLLAAVEARYRGLFIIVLGVTAADSALINDYQWLEPGFLKAGREPISIVAIPGPIDADVERSAMLTTPRLRAIEYVDGSPRGLEQRARQAGLIRDRAETLGLTLVAGSNLHGWGYTAAAWSLVTVPDWRDRSPDSLGVLLELALARPGAVSIVERKRFRGETAGPRVALTAVDMLAGTVTQLTLFERAAWIGWIWVVSLFLRRRYHSSLPVPS